jgi:hypothetical protein
MLKKLILIAAASLCFVATPAHAQSVGALLDLVVNGGAAIERAKSGGVCRYTQGVANVACRINGARQVQYHVSAYQQRVANERRIAEARRAVREGRPTTVSGNHLQLCSWGIASYCNAVGIQPAEAARLLAARSGPKLEEVQPQRYYVSADERSDAVDAM